MKRILLPTDFSDNARRAVRYALSMFPDPQTTFTLLHAYSVPHTSPDISISVTDILREQALKNLEDEWALLSEERLGKGRKVKLVAEYGFPESVVARWTARNQTDLVVMGTKGASGLREVLIGSNTSSVIRTTKVPLLVVPEEADFRPLEKIVFATDLQHLETDAVLDPMKELAERYNAQVCILNVVLPEQPVRAEAALEGLHLHHYFDDTRHSYDFCENKDVFSGIGDFVEEREADLLVMITRELNFVDRLFHRSVARRMAHHTRVPLLVLHH